MSNLKLVSGIIIIGLSMFSPCPPPIPSHTSNKLIPQPNLVNQKAAIVCLAMLIYYIFASELSSMLQPKDEDEEEKPKKRKKVPTVSTVVARGIWIVIDVYVCVNRDRVWL